MKKFAGLDRAQGEAGGLAISLEMAKAAPPYADGLYPDDPLQPGWLMERLIGGLKQEEVLRHIDKTPKKNVIFFL